MFLSLLVITFLISVLVSALVARLFHPAVSRILQRILADDIYSAWVRYMLFAVFVVGVSSGVRIWDLEKYITPREFGEVDAVPLALNTERWVLEVYRTVIGTLQGVAWLLLVFFVFALIGYIVVRIAEMRTRAGGGSDGSSVKDP